MCVWSRCGAQGYHPTPIPWELEAGVGSATVTVIAGDLVGHVGLVKTPSPFLILLVEVPPVRRQRGSSHRCSATPPPTPLSMHGLG